MRIYTRTGDQGTTGMLYGGRLPKDALAVELNGDVDELQAHLGLVRATAAGELAELLLHVELDLWVLMAEVATLPENRGKLVPGKTLVEESMVSWAEATIDAISARFDPPREFVVPGQHPVAAALDVARTVARRAERHSAAWVREIPDSKVQVYLNRTSDLLWTLARWQEGQSLTARGARRA